MASAYSLSNDRPAGSPDRESSPCTWRAVGAAAIGTSHRKQDLPCQDAQGYMVIRAAGQDVFAAAVADGAGSAEFSERGAQRAVEAALEALETAVLESEDHSLEAYAGLLYLAFEQAQAAVLDLASAEELSPRSLASTLTCALANSYGAAAAQLGDGAVVAQAADGSLLAVTQPQRGEYANETYFLVQEDALEHLEIVLLEAPLQALAVLSDGLLRLAMQMPANEPHAPFFTPLFAFAAAASDPESAAGQLGAFLDSERVCARTDDDKSLVLAVCRNGQAAPAPGESQRQA